MLEVPRSPERARWLAMPRGREARPGESLRAGAWLCDGGTQADASVCPPVCPECGLHGDPRAWERTNHLGSGAI